MQCKVKQLLPPGTGTATRNRIGVATSTGYCVLSSAIRGGRPQEEEEEEQLALKLRWITSSASNGDSINKITAIREVRKIHARLIRSAAVKTYHYNLLIRCYTRLHSPCYALPLYLCIPRSSLLPDSYTLPITLKALSLSPSPSPALLAQLHSVAVRLCLHSHAYCESALIALYSRLGQPHHARNLLDQNPHPRLPSWNALIAGLSHAALPRQALGAFLHMRRRGLLPDDVTMVAVNSACGSLGDLRLALQLHKLAFQAARNVDGPHRRIFLPMMHNSLIDMYGKCARLELAARVFSTMPPTLRNVSSWTSMIVGHAMHGHADVAISLFHRMVHHAGLAPNHVTFVGLLAACVHAGKLQEGKRYFDAMRRVYGITPRLQHYGCMVDLLGRAGLLREARELIEGMPMEPNAVILGCLLGSCDKHGDVEMAQWVAERLRELEPSNHGVYVVLSNIYATRGLWDEAERARLMMKRLTLGKSPAYSCSSTAPD